MRVRGAIVEVDSESWSSTRVDGWGWNRDIPDFRFQSHRPQHVPQRHVSL